MCKEAKFEDLVGKTLVEVVLEHNNEVMWFRCSDGSVYKMYHEQDCCESVYVEDITEGWSEVLNNNALVVDAYESYKVGGSEEAGYYESQTWTFYRLITNKGYVIIRWLGTSNGYYSESVDFVQVS